MTALTPEYLETVATIIDRECTTCHSAPTAQQGTDSRTNIAATLDGLAVIVNSEGQQGTRFATGLKETCAHCLASNRPLATLENRFSCGIRSSSWQLKPRHNSTGK